MSEEIIDTKDKLIADIKQQPEYKNPQNGANADIKFNYVVQIAKLNPSIANDYDWDNGDITISENDILNAVSNKPIITSEMVRHKKLKFDFRVKPDGQNFTIGLPEDNEFYSTSDAKQYKLKVSIRRRQKGFLGFIGFHGGKKTRVRRPRKSKRSKKSRSRRQRTR